MGPVTSILSTGLVSSTYQHQVLVASNPNFCPIIKFTNRDSSLLFLLIKRTSSSRILEKQDSLQIESNFSRTLVIRRFCFSRVSVSASAPVGRSAFLVRLTAC